jgi:hypothetical protein
LKNREQILSFNDYFQSKQFSKTKITQKCYIPIAEAIMESEDIYLTETQRYVLSFISNEQLSFYDWYMLKEDSWFSKLNTWLQDTVGKTADTVKSVVSSAVNWVVELGTNLAKAIEDVVKKIMDSVKSTWEAVKIETNNWFSGNKSLKRQITISLNQQISGIKESLNETSSEEYKEIWNTLSKETGQLSSMFVDSVSNIIHGEVFASKVTMSLNKAVNESKVDNHIENNIKNSIIELLPSAITEGIVDINNHKKLNSSSMRIKSFSDMKKLNESIEMIEKFYEWSCSKLDMLPPFSWIKEFSEYIKTNGNQALEYSSKFLNEHFSVAGPYEFKVMGPTFAILISAMSDFGKYILIDKIIAGLAGILIPIPGISQFVMFLLTIYAFWVLGEVIYELITDFSEEETQIAQ